MKREIERGGGGEIERKTGEGGEREKEGCNVKGGRGRT